MTSGMEKSLSHLSELAVDGGRERRTMVLRLIADLFMQTPEQISEGERKSHDRLMTQLASEAGPVMRRELAERLAAHERPPLELVRMLARDEIDVARALLRHSPALGDDDIVRIAKSRTRAHRLAIAERATVSAEVCDALVLWRESDVLLTLVRNEGAELSASARHAIASSAERDDEIATALLSRRDLDGEALLRLFWDAEPVLRRDIIEIARASSTLTTAEPRGNSVLRHASGAEHASALTGLAQLVVNGRMDEFRDLFASSLGVPMPLMEQILSDPYGEPFLLACRAAGFPQETFTTMLLLYNPPVSQSIARVYALAEMYISVPPALAWHFVESWMAPRADKTAHSAAQHMPAMVAPERGAQRPRQDDARPAADRAASVGLRGRVA
jgi:uncharacterized protein (DUF2336 family)